MKKVGQMLGAAIGKQEVIRAAAAMRLLRDWSSIVGEEMARRSYPDRYERGVVWIAVQGSAWAQELRMQSDTILERLRSKANDDTLFNQLRFGVRALPKSEREPEKVEAPVQEDTSELSIRDIAERGMRKWRDVGNSAE